MGVGLVARGEFVAGFNRAFGAGQVAATASRLGPLLRSMDALEIVYRLDLLPGVRPDQLLRYRDTVGIPALHMQVMTAVVQAVLHAPGGGGAMLSIVEGPAEAVSVAQKDGRIEVTLTRTRFDAGESTAGAR